MIAAAVREHHDTYTRATTFKLFAAVAIILFFCALYRHLKAGRDARRNNQLYPPDRLATRGASRRAVGPATPAHGVRRAKPPGVTTIRRPDPLGGPRPALRRHARRTRTVAGPQVFVAPPRDPDFYVVIDGITFGGWNL